MINNINISLNEIKKNYNLNDDFFEIVKGLYNGSKKIKKINTDKIINLNGDNFLFNLDKLFGGKEELYGKCGVYIFLNDLNEPVYIGVSGEENSKQDLRTRLSFHFNANSSNSNLVDNIIEIEYLLNGKNLLTEKKKERKQLISLKCPTLLMIVFGDLNSSVAIKKSQEFEKILIALFNSKYNK